ncbi:hypothetical protein GMO_26190 [Gluconobacter morbifer G707]|uniref:Uncharacterized protein n=1 Tax=Gluconobacter morbifer G707 TaxID=1088869 RepID=G6XMA1_9PROT|nr:hypothetical protein GMO_26190 [Gluconobacter morbifer G707]
MAAMGGAGRKGKVSGRCRMLRTELEMFLICSFHQQSGHVAFG